MDKFFTWEILATLAGAIAGVGVITQFTKKYFMKIDTQLLSYIYAIVILVAAYFFTDILTVESGALIPINAVIVSLSANGAFSVVDRKIVNKK